MNQTFCDKHGTTEGVKVCPHVNPKTLSSGDSNKKILGVRHELSDQVATRMAVCIDCVKGAFDGIEPDNPENIDGSVLLREVVTDTMCSMCLKEFGVSI